MEEVGRDPGKLRIAFSSRSLSGAGVSDEVHSALEATARLCEDPGHHVAEAEPEINRSRALKAFGSVWVGLLGQTIRSLSEKLEREATEADFEGITWAMYQSNTRVSAAEYLGIIESLQAMNPKIAVLFKDYDVWLTPTLCWDPVPPGYFAFTPETRDEHICRFGEYSGCTTMFNGSDQPAMTLPLQWSDRGLPLGMQIVGGYADEATLFHLAGQLEQAQLWAHLRLVPRF